MICYICNKQCANPPVIAPPVCATCVAEHELVLDFDASVPTRRMFKAEEAQDTWYDGFTIPIEQLDME